MPNLRIIDLSTESDLWNDALLDFQEAKVGHLHEWGKIIKQTYGMENIYLAAVNGTEIRGLLPLVLIKSKIFTRALVSMPYLNDGGILAKDQEAELLLWQEAKNLMKKGKASYMELRHNRDMDLGVDARQDKVSMILDLTGGKEDVWMKKIDRNVRNKIRKSAKLGVEIKEGPEWLRAFYQMYLIKMQELGSPPHSLNFFKETMEALKDKIKIYVAVTNSQVVGGKVVCHFKDTLYFLWVSSPRKYFKYAAVDLMDWQAIEDAIGKGIKYCDFGRSTVDSSYYDFKKKWGTTPVQLYWHTYPSPQGNSGTAAFKSEKYRFFSELWKRVPLPLAKLIGPRLRAGMPL